MRVGNVLRNFTTQVLTLVDEEIINSLHEDSAYFYVVVDADIVAGAENNSLLQQHLTCNLYNRRS